MLSGSHFYHQTIRRCTVAFGSLFKDLVLVKYANDASRQELSRQTVPLVYGGKEDFWLRIQALPDLPAAVDLNLPTITFSLTGIEYASQRKQQSQLQNVVRNSNVNGVSRMYMGVPYDLHYTLTLITRNIEEGFQIVEQIFPYFNPDYTLTMKFVDDMNIIKDVPIILNSAAWENDYEGEAKQTMRSVTWTLDFTMQAMFYGPVSAGGGIIKTANVNLWNYSALTGQQDYNLTIANDSVANGNLHGGFLPGEFVYQGNNIPEATASGFVIAWYPDRIPKTLVLRDVEGSWAANTRLTGGLNLGSANVWAVPNTSGPIVTVSVTPDPPTSNGPPADFGFITVIDENP